MRRPSESSDGGGAARGPGGIGSYLARQEFGSVEDGSQPVSHGGGPPGVRGEGPAGQTSGSHSGTGVDSSGYVSHGSGGAYPKLQLPVSGNETKSQNSFLMPRISMPGFFITLFLRIKKGKSSGVFYP